ncbi:MAG: hypothetical protein KI790_14470, partial [Cyclobacteriaceae bacterium]|nr:hypothetical protein [Cyclobacteriaceae bacterium HetDA_MAG_MS6]
MKYSSALFALVLAVCNSYGQVSLPYFQDFEEVTDSTYTEATTSIAGLPFFSFEKADNSNNVIVGFQKGQEGSKGIDLRGDDEDVTSNGLILTLDLSDRDTLNDDILLNLLVNLSCFNAAFEGGGPCGQQKLFIRGSDSDDWMFFYDMNPLWRNLSTFTPLQYASLTDSLKANQQNFSSTTQIKIFSSGLSFRMDELEVFERPAQDIKLFSVSSPQPRFGLSNSEEVTVQVTNLGSDTEADLPITLQVNGPMGMQEIDKVLSSPLNKNDTAQVIFDQVDMSLIGNYDIVAFSGLSEDNDPSNDTISGYSIHRDRFTGDLPFFEDFNDMTAGAVYIEKSAALPTIDGFSYQSSDQNGRLYVSQRSDNPENLFLGLGRRSDLLGNMLISNELILTLDLSNYLAADDELLLDFSFYFESVFVDFNQDNRVFVRGSQDEEWLELYDWFENRPESPFNLKTIREMNISDTLLANGQDFSDTFQLLFRENNNFGRSVVYIDNIAVYERKNIDLQLLSTDAFQPAVHPIADTISILAYNFGKDSIPNIPVNVQVTGQGLDTLIQSTVMQSVAGGDSITLEINHDLNLDQVGFYDITTFHSLDGDEDRSNDTVRYTTYKRDLSNASLPIELAFTELPFDTIQSLIAPSVEGIPGFSYSTDSEFGVHGIANTVFNRTTSKAFFMENNQTFGSTIFSELIYSLDLSSYDVQNNDLLLSITSGFRSSFSFTDNRLWIRGSEEDPWISFFDLFENRYENTDYLSISDRLKDADQNFSGTFQIRFRLEQMRRSAFFLKDLSIYERPENDVQVVTIIKPDDQTVFGNSENIGIRVNNQGKSTITSLPLNLEVRGPVDTVLLSQSFDTNLSSLDTIEYIFSGLDLSRDGYYDILVYSSLEGDPNQLYDTLRTGIKNLQVNPGNLPYVEGFELPSSGVRFRNSNFQINGLSGWSVENGSVQSRTEWQTEGQ